MLRDVASVNHTHNFTRLSNRDFFEVILAHHAANAGDSR